jgi:hypothetical protein
MRYEIDQSIKIEDTAKTTYVALTNSKDVIVSIHAGEKKKLKKYFRSLGRPLTFKLFSFSALCAKALSLSKTNREDLIVIDIEYPGYNRNIKSYINSVLKFHALDTPDMVFQEISRHSRAHKRVYRAFKTKERCVAVDAKWIIKLTGCLLDA